MSDVFSRQKRSEVMSRIKGSGNLSTEMRLIEIFRRKHIVGWRRKYPVKGRPDFIFPRERVAVFVDGCFWHSCPKCSRVPKQNRAFWVRKLKATRERDSNATQVLQWRGWRVLRIWEHELNNAANYVLKRIRGVFASADKKTGAK